MKQLILLTFSLLFTVSCNATTEPVQKQEKGNVVFIHPDGTGVGHWNLLRLVTVGPDGMTNWDQMDQLGLYRPHQSNSLVTTSHAGATVHAYGRKVHYDSYGMDRKEPLIALSGKPMSIMQEAMAEGIKVGVVNSGHIAEPGTGVFLASAESRKYRTEIADKVLNSGADVIFSGGEIYTLPKGTIGRHGEEGRREDGRNLLLEAEQNGYTVIYTKEELLQLSPDTQKVIGIFAAKNTYNDKREEQLIKDGLPTYNPEQPSFDEMVSVALKLLSNDPKQQFFLVAEEEGTDNFSNKANATGTIDALKRADAAIGVTMEFMANRSHEDTLLIVAGDSDAGHPAVWANHTYRPTGKVPTESETGAPLDGVEGIGTTPFETKPDANGVTYTFAVAWPLSDDSYGSAVASAHGFKSDSMGRVVDNTAIYKIMYDALFGKRLND